MPELKNEPLISAQEISDRLDQVAAEVNAKQGDNELLVLGILKGSFVFVADFIRRLTCPVRIEFIGVKMKEEANNRRAIEYYSNFNITGKDVLIMEDILDTGITLDFLRGHLEKDGPNSLAIFTLLDKIESHKINIKPEYVGFEIPDAFVVGYGLDFEENYRQLPYIGIVDGATWALAED